MQSKRRTESNVVAAFSPVELRKLCGFKTPIGIQRAIDKREAGTFKYLDKGSMATIGRRRAVAAVGKLHMSGLLAWLAWLTVHIFYLIDFRNRVVVLFDWAWSYFTYQRGSRLITGHRLEAGVPARLPMTSEALASPPVPAARESSRAS